MRRACKLARTILDAAGPLATPGNTTQQIDQLVTRMSFDAGAYPSPLSYRGFPKSVCTSVNNVACHGIPDDRELREGDIVNVDVTVFIDGVHGDCSDTFVVGDPLPPDDQVSRLISATYECRDAAIDACSPGTPFNHLGSLIQRIAQEKHSFR